MRFGDDLSAFVIQGDTRLIQCLANRAAILTNACLGKVFPGIEITHAALLPGRHKAPAEECDECQAAECDNAADCREIEHAEIAYAGVPGDAQRRLE